MSFNPAKVSLMAFAVLFKILSAYCEEVLYYQRLLTNRSIVLSHVKNFLNP